MSQRWAAVNKWAEQHWVAFGAIAAILIGGLMAVTAKPAYGLVIGALWLTRLAVVGWARYH